MAKAPSRREQRYQQAQGRSRKRMLLIVGAGVVVAAVIAGIVVTMSGGGGDDNKVVAQLTLDEYSITGDLEVPAGDIRLEAVNRGAVPHNVGIVDGPITSDLRSGEEGSVDIGELAPGSYQLYCDILGHIGRGMVATLTVTDAVPET